MTKKPFSNYEYQRPEGIKTDIGYNNAFWMKVSDKKAIGFGEMEGTFGPPEDIEAWIFNEFSKEAKQLGTKAVNFRKKSSIKTLKKLRKNVNRQIEILEAEKEIPIGSKNEGYHSKNNRNKKGTKSRGS